MTRNDRGAMTVALALSFPALLAAVACLACVLRDGAARTEVQELAFQAADAAVAANDSAAAEEAATHSVSADDDARAMCLDPEVRLRDPGEFTPAGTVDIDVQCDVELLPGWVRTYIFSARRWLDPYRQMGQP